MPAISPRELIVLALVLLLVFGYRRIPEIGRSLGSGMRGFRDSLSGGSLEEVEAGSRENDAPSVDERR